MHSGFGRKHRELALIAIIPNLPFLVVAAGLGHNVRGLINVEYFFVAVLALFVSRAIVGFVLALIFLNEIFHLAASTYYFSDADFLKSASYLSCLPIGRVITLSLILVLLVLAWTYIVLKLAGPHIHHDRRRSLAVLASAIVFLVTVDVATGNNTRLGLRDTSLDANVASGPMLGLIISVAADKLGGFGHSNKEMNAAASASAPLFAPLRAVKTTSGSFKARNVVLIVVESFGKLLNPASAEWLSSPFYSPAMRNTYHIEEGEVPFRGATVSAEYRELCGVSGSVAQITTPDPLLETNLSCLPALMQRAGFETHAFHGYSGNMFDRNEWYPSLGFEHSTFIEDLSSPKAAPRCGAAWPGVCDEYMVGLLRDLLLRPKSDRPQFIYWLSLNSHLPVDRESATADGVGCGSSNAVTDEDLCAWMSLVYRVNKAVATLATSSGIPPTEFIIVGDHAPPFLAQTRRRAVSQSVVPYIRLIPQESLPRKPQLVLATRHRQLAVRR
jgi:hypothetical protein